jgi:hypothetical protein
MGKKSKSFANLMTEEETNPTLYYFRLLTGEELCAEVPLGINLTRAPKDRQIFLLKNPMRLHLVPIDETSYAFMPNRWVYKSVVAGDYFPLFGKAIIGWGKAAEDISKVYYMAIKAMGEMEKERAEKKSVYEEKVDLARKLGAIVKNQIPSESATKKTPSRKRTSSTKNSKDNNEPNSTSNGTVTVISSSKPRANITLEDFESHLKEQESKPKN